MIKIESKEGMKHLGGGVVDWRDSDRYKNLEIKIREKHNLSEDIQLYYIMPKFQSRKDASSVSVYMKEGV